MKKLILLIITPCIIYSAVKVPADYYFSGHETKSVDDGTICASVYARKFSQGELSYLEITPKTGISGLKVSFGTFEPAITSAEWGYRCFIPFGPYEKTGKREITVSYFQAGKYSITHLFFNIEEKKYNLYNRALDVGNFSVTGNQTKPETVQFIKECQERKNRAFSSNGKDLVGSSFSHPRDSHYITSYFWEKRKYQRYRIVKKKRIYEKSRESIHRGVDFRGNTGTPVFAMAKGRVVLSARMHYEGNMVIIDHGNKFFTYYMHMSRLTAEEGTIVEAGTKIGEVGTTGISTGPHLHVSAVIRDIQFDPLSILNLPVRDISK